MTHRCSLPSVLCGPHEPSPSVCPSGPGPHPGCHVAPRLPVSPGSSAVSVSQTVLGLMTLMVQGGWDRYWIGHPPAGICLMVFLIIRVYGLGEETQGAESPCGRVVSINAITGLITGDVTSVTWLRGWLSSASHPFSAALSGNNLLRTDPSEKAGSYAPRTWASRASLVLKNWLTNAGTQRRGISPWVGRALKEKMATRSSILA